MDLCLEKCQIFKAKMHQVRFTALPRPPSCIKGHTSKEREGNGERRGREGNGRGGG